MQLPRAILFDLDDTILAYEAVSVECWQQVCRSFAPFLGGLEADTLVASIEEVRAWYWGDLERDRRGRLDLPTARQEIVAAAFERLGSGNSALAHEIADAYNPLKEKAVKPFPGATETLRYLQNRGTRLALLTNGTKEFQRAKIDRFGLETLFDCILIEGEFGTGKPDQRVFSHALERLNTLTSDAWMVGDNLHADIAGAQALNIYSIWVDWSASGLPAGSTVRPDHVIHSISQLQDKGLSSTNGGVT